MKSCYCPHGQVWDAQKNHVSQSRAGGVYIPPEILSIIALYCYDPDDPNQTARVAASLSMTSWSFFEHMGLVLYDKMDPGCLCELDKVRRDRESHMSYFFSESKSKKKALEKELATQILAKMPSKPEKWTCPVRDVMRILFTSNRDHDSITQYYKVHGPGKLPFVDLKAKVNRILEIENRKDQIKAKLDSIGAPTLFVMSYLTTQHDYYFKSKGKLEPFFEHIEPLVTRIIGLKIELEKNGFELSLSILCDSYISYNIGDPVDISVKMRELKFFREKTSYIPPDDYGVPRNSCVYDRSVCRRVDKADYERTMLMLSKEKFEDFFSVPDSIRRKLRMIVFREQFESNFNQKLLDLFGLEINTNYLFIHKLRVSCEVLLSSESSFSNDRMNEAFEVYTDASSQIREIARDSKLDEDDARKILLKWAKTSDVGNAKDFAMVHFRTIVEARRIRVLFEEFCQITSIDKNLLRSFMFYSSDDDKVRMCIRMRFARSFLKRSNIFISNYPDFVTGLKIEIGDKEIKLRLKFANMRECEAALVTK